MEEQDLISGLRNQNEGAVNYFVRMYQQFVFAVVYRMIEKREEAEEITQDVLIKCIEKIDGFHASASLKTWMYRIARNETINHIRSEQRKIDTISDEQVKVLPIHSANSTESDLSKNEMRSVIFHYLNRLSEEQKEILILFYLKELSLQEISEAMDCTVNNTKVKLFRAREQFGKLLSKNDVELLNEMRYG